MRRNRRKSAPPQLARLTLVDFETFQFLQSKIVPLYGNFCKRQLKN